MANIEHRIGALAKRVTTIEEDQAALTDTVYDIHRRVTGLEINMETLLDHFGLPKAGKADVDAKLDAE